MNLKKAYCITVCVIYYSVRAFVESLFACQMDGEAVTML